MRRGHTRINRVNPAAAAHRDLAKHPKGAGGGQESRERLVPCAGRQRRNPAGREDRGGGDARPRPPRCLGWISSRRLLAKLCTICRGEDCMVGVPGPGKLVSQPVTSVISLCVSEKQQHNGSRQRTVFASKTLPAAAGQPGLNDRRSAATLGRGSQSAHR